MIKRRPLALYAIIDQAEYIGRKSPASAERFLDATEKTFKQLEKMPGLGHLHESADKRLRGVRIWAVKGFPNHLIFYRTSDAEIEILHVLHGARDIDAALGEALREGEL